MISIVISEKGGAERRERFSKNEISVGRVKGNDVLLSKGNVSKRHARLMVRDGRFIVTDLKSTNGTYVNHRRITHATLVREGDRIYIGDFVLWIEGDEDHADTPMPESPDDFGTGPDSQTASSSFERSNSNEAISPPVDLTPGAEEVVSHFPIEHDPDESSPSYDVPGPPRVPSGFKPGSTGSAPAALEMTGRHENLVPAPTEGPQGISTLGASEPAGSSLVGQSSQPRVDRAKLKEQQQVLDELVRSILEGLDVQQLDGTQPPSSELVEQVEKEIDGCIAKLVEEGPLPADLEEQSLREATRRELLELGPLGPLLEDEKISELHVFLREITVVRRNRKLVHRGLGFTSETAVARVLNRLCAESEKPIASDETHVERQLENGMNLFSARPPASPLGHLVVLKRPPQLEASLNTLVRNGTISRGMAALLAHCVAARANILVVGASDSGTPHLVRALAGAIPSNERVVWLGAEGNAGQIPAAAAAIPFGSDPAERQTALQTVARLRPDHLVAPPMRSGDELAELLDTMATGIEGVILSAYASTLRQAVGRLSAAMAGSRAGLTPNTAREWFAAAFDIGLEVTRLRDGRLRVARLAEFRTGSKGTSLRDVFTFAYHRTATGGSIEGSFYASGTVPHIVEDLNTRGMPLDTSIFRRHPSG